MQVSCFLAALPYACSEAFTVVLPWHAPDFAVLTFPRKMGLYWAFGDDPTIDPVCQRCPDTPPEELARECTHPSFKDAPVTAPVYYTD
jgi:hypothetical protein